MGHGERVEPSNEEYSLFFDLLRVFDWRTEPVDGPFSTRVLSQYRNVIVGDPRRRFSSQEAIEIRDWVNNGGNLLALANMGGDAAPGGELNSATNLGELVGRVEFNDDTLGFDRGVGAGGPFDTKLLVDLGDLMGVPGRLCYDTGCSLSRSPGLECVELVTPPGSFVVDGIRLQSQRITEFRSHPRNAGGRAILVRFSQGSGCFTVFGSARSFIDDTIVRDSNTQFLSWLVLKAFPNLFSEHVAHYSSLPQRHRLLHGYPYPNWMERGRPGFKEKSGQERIMAESRKPLIVGVLPHTSCNPMVRGCGFCTFPHEPYRLQEVRATVSSVLDEIEGYTRRHRRAMPAPVEAVYFGGGTANLTPPDQFAALCGRLANDMDCRDAEVTLEGVPAYFEKNDFECLETMRQHFTGGPLRISMGVQTFDETLLGKMGRTRFGDRACVQRTAQAAMARGFQVSGDLLFNLPGQSLDAMVADVRELAEVGFDQISIYHLVMFRTLGPEWSKDPGILSALPDNQEAMENWLGLRAELLALGYSQTTLTNFERADACRFRYERNAFNPEAYNWLGFGPAAISLLTGDTLREGIKLQNPEAAAEYKAGKSWGRWDRSFN